MACGDGRRYMAMASSFPFSFHGSACAEEGTGMTAAIHGSFTILFSTLLVIFLRRMIYFLRSMIFVRYVSLLR